MSRFRCEGCRRLQEVSGNTEETAKSGNGASNSLVARTGESGGLSSRWDNNGANWSGCWGNNWDDSSGIGERASKTSQQALSKNCVGNSMGYQVLQYTTGVTVGLKLTVHGQLVMVIVSDCNRTLSTLFFLKSAWGSNIQQWQCRSCR